MIQELKELNDNFYELAGQLYENKVMLSDEMFGYMQKVILEQYRLEYELLAAEGRIEPERKVFAAEIRHGLLAPAKRRTILFWRRDKRWNTAALQLMEREEREAARFFEDGFPGEGNETCRSGCGACTNPDGTSNGCENSNEVRGRAPSA